MTGREAQSLQRLKVAVVGAGSAGIGVARALLMAMEQVPPWPSPRRRRTAGCDRFLALMIGWDDS